MQPGHSPEHVGFGSLIRPAASRGTTRTATLLILASLLGVGCRTPWSIEPLPLASLQTGMHPDAVRAVLGEPQRIGAPRKARFPDTWPHLRSGAEIHPSQAWHYEDEKVDPIGLVFFGLALPVTLPIHLVGVASRFDESERDCMWIEEREIALYFEDERLAEWVETIKPERESCVADPNWQPTFTQPTFTQPPWWNGRRGC